MPTTSFPTSLAACDGAVTEARSDGLVVAEHAYDARADLRLGAWHGTMNYAGFTRPVWTWLRGENLPSDPASGFIGLPVGVPRLPGESIVRTMRAFRAGVPWTASLHSWAILDSHDSARFSVIAGSRERQLVGVGLQMTTPGVPMVFAGDEIGLGGDWGEDARRTMPWSRPETWDTAALDGYRELIALRREKSRARARRDPLRARVRGRDRLRARGARRHGALPGDARSARSGAPAARPDSAPASSRRSSARTLPSTAIDAVLPTRRAGVPCLESRVTTKEGPSG